MKLPQRVLGRGLVVIDGYNARLDGRFSGLMVDLRLRVKSGEARIRRVRQSGMPRNRLINPADVFCRRFVDGRLVGAVLATFSARLPPPSDLTAGHR